MHPLKWSHWNVTMMFGIRENIMMWLLLDEKCLMICLPVSNCIDIIHQYDWLTESDFFSSHPMCTFVASWCGLVQGCGINRVLERSRNACMQLFQVTYWADCTKCLLSILTQPRLNDIYAHYFWMPPTVTDYRGHRRTLLPVWEINLKACALGYLTHTLSAGAGDGTRLILTTCQIQCSLCCATKIGLDLCLKQKLIAVA